jgi:carbon storage regulator CsrA
MLVLTRRPQEQILLPTVPAAVRVIAARPNLVRLGIEAPPEVRVFRAEVYPGLAAEGFGPAPAARKPTWRDQLDSLRLGLAQLRRKLLRDRTPGPLAALARLDREFEALRQELQMSLDAPFAAEAPAIEVAVP